MPCRQPSGFVQRLDLISISLVIAPKVTAFLSFCPCRFSSVFPQPSYWIFKNLSSRDFHLSKLLYCCFMNVGKCSHFSEGLMEGFKTCPLVTYPLGLSVLAMGCDFVCRAFPSVFHAFSCAWLGALHTAGAFPSAGDSKSGRWPRTPRPPPAQPPHAPAYAHTPGAHSLPECGISCSAGPRGSRSGEGRKTRFRKLVQIPVRNAVFDFILEHRFISSWIVGIFLDQTFRTKWGLIPLRKSAAN